MTIPTPERTPARRAADALRAAMAAAGVTSVTRLSGASRVSPDRIYALLDGRVELTTATWPALARVLDVDPWKLMEGEVVPAVPPPFTAEDAVRVNTALAALDDLLAHWPERFGGVASLRTSGCSAHVEDAAGDLRERLAEIADYEAARARLGAPQASSARAAAPKATDSAPPLDPAALERALADLPPARFEWVMGRLGVTLPVVTNIMTIPERAAVMVRTLARQERLDVLARELARDAGAFRPKGRGPA